MSHEASFVESGLPVEQHIVSCLDMAVDYLVLVIVPQVPGMRDPLLFAQTIQPRDLAVFLDIVSAWVFLAVDDVRLQFLQVVLVDVLAEG